MSMASPAAVVVRSAPLLLLLLLLLLPATVKASSALAVAAGPNWLGIDGTWSTFDLQIGSNNSQTVSLAVSTALSEIWVVEDTGCARTPLCTGARGGVYDINSSSTWRSLGAWQLGLSDLGLGGNGDYGMEAIALTNLTTHTAVPVNSALVAGINDTDYYIGYIGVGATQGRFGDNVVNPLISQLAESLGDIPSHSYGYTAGASYAGSNGTPASLTLGGYDANRFVPHGVAFNMNPRIRLPQVLLRGIIASVPSLDKAPTQWNSTSQVLASMNDSQVAYIDTSTPYLWLPENVCDRFAQTLGLVWNETYGVYLFRSNQQYNDFLNGSSLSFTFPLSSFDNMDSFGQPFNTHGVVNITVSSAAFALTIRYPFSPTMQFGDPAIPYFPLKRNPANHSTIIGRAFMQEAYLVARYDDNGFSIYQALFPQNAASNTSIVDIQRAADSPFPPDDSPSASGNTGGGPGGLSAAATAGIVVAAFVTGSIVGVVIWCCRRRSRKEKQRSTQGAEDEVKDSGSSVDSEPPPSPIERIFSFITRRRKPRRPVVHEVQGESAQPAVEVAADSNHELYELPVPLEPVELDSTSGGSIGEDDATELGTDGSQNLSPYEIARRKLQKQLQGPVPTYAAQPPGDKTEQDVSPVAHYRPGDDASPVSAPSYGHATNSLPNTIPSPVSPHAAEWTSHFDLPSPMTVAPPFPLPSPQRQRARSDSTPSDIDSPNGNHLSTTRSRSDSSGGSSTHSPLSLVPPSATYQRTPIDPSRVICLGPLPENVQLPGFSPPSPSVPRLLGPDGQTVDALAASGGGMTLQTTSLERHRTNNSTSTLGSNFTVDEEHRLREHSEMTRRQSFPRPDEDGIPHSPNSAERIDAASELVHVPQPAEKRYSWEDER